MSQRINDRTIAAAGIGNVLEWYDFTTYGFLAPVFAAKFFPSDDPLTSLVAAFGVFAAGYLTRPFGALIFGHIGDRLSRKSALTLSIALMAVPTSLIAFLPTHASIGIGAAVLLTGLRLLQGVSVGGEYTGSAIFLIERAPNQRRGLFGSICLASGTLGTLLASGVAALLTYLIPAEAFSDWGWRLAFVPAPILGVIGYFLRRNIKETNQPSALDNATRRSIPIVEAVRDHGGAMLRLGAIAGSMGIIFYTSFVFLTSYLTEFAKTPSAVALEINTAAIALLTLLLPVSAALSDRLGRRPVMLAGSIALIVFAYPLFVLLLSGNDTIRTLAALALALLVSTMGGPFAGLMVELFPRRVRYTAVSFAFSLPMGVLGGTAPLVTTWLIVETGSDLSPAFYLIAAAALVSITLLFTNETKDRDLD